MYNTTREKERRCKLTRKQRQATIESAITAIAFGLSAASVLGNAASYANVTSKTPARDKSGKFVKRVAA